MPAADLRKLLPLIADSVRPRLDEGRVADYIPALACIDRRKFGIAVITTNGALYAAGDAEERFSIQSVSKVFTLTLALEKAGAGLWERVGREPSGTTFNSIVQLERESGMPRNPFINAGAIVVTDVILGGRPPSAAISEIVGLVQRLSQDGSVAIDPEVARSEAETGFRNASLANFMKSFGNLESSVEDCLQTYFHQCALSMSCVQLARAGLFLANGGVDPLTGERIVNPDRARRINALMLTCGHYDASGDFAFRVGCRARAASAAGFWRWRRSMRRSRPGRPASMRAATRSPVPARWRCCRRRPAGRFSRNSARRVKAPASACRPSALKRCRLRRP